MTSSRAGNLLWTVPSAFQASALDTEIWKHQQETINITNTFVSVLYLCKKLSYVALWGREARQVLFFDKWTKNDSKKGEENDHWQGGWMFMFVCVCKLTCVLICICLYIYAHTHTYIHTFLLVLTTTMLSRIMLLSFSKTKNLTLWLVNFQHQLVELALELTFPDS